ncbi:WecB/TagA/CpsF family glycosyltransferase [Pseudoalteromonas rhizosphaerae]|uniref:WecB/TagA/CpsF family glycosyltransferase n=1 Tax=Pseudoalteromonas rhizosphaerae TaxID=2518973 RepID=UPI0021488B1D|nr:WecB/TagA/CpsF family glycosyltransferase [Pseudoalteromonas rhizosphaerae]
MANNFTKLNNKFSSKKDWQEKVKQLTYSNNDSDKIIATFVNPYSYPILQDEPELWQAFNMIFSDGLLHTKLHNIFCENKIDRVSFDLSSIAKDTLLRAQEQRLKVAFIGGKPEHAVALPAKLFVLFPNLIISYCRDGYFDLKDEKQRCFTELDNCTPDIIIVGMGTPLQEQFLLQCVERVKSAREFYTCGGFLEQTATKGDYYHPLVKKLGLRWLQRAIMHKHVRDRLIRDYPQFIVKYCMSHFK